MQTVTTTILWAAISRFAPSGQRPPGRAFDLPESNPLAYRSPQMSLLPEVIATSVLASVLLLMLVWIERLRTRGVPAEQTRKLAHAITCVTLVGALPMFGTVWLPALLAIGFLVLLGVAKKAGWLRSVFAIDRKSHGASLIPVAAFSTYLLADGTAVQFVLPMLILGLADPVAAFVGTHRGRMEYSVFGERRTVEGSLAFALVTAVLSMGTLLFFGAPLEVAVPLTVMVSLFTTGIESVCPRGTDNLGIPVAAWWVLWIYVDVPATELWGRLAIWLPLGIIMTLMFVGTLSWRRSQARPHARIGRGQGGSR